MFDPQPWLSEPCPSDRLVENGSGENTSPVDELAATRAKIRRLQAREADLRTTVLSLDTTDRVGKLYKAKVDEQTRTVPDLDLIRDEMGETWLAKRSRVSVVKIVRLTAIKETSGSEPREKPRWLQA